MTSDRLKSDLVTVGIFGKRDSAKKFSLLKCCTFVCFLTVLIVIFAPFNMDPRELQHKVNSMIISRKVPADDICTFQPLPPAGAQEERLLLDAIAWPETPVVTNPSFLERSSDPAHSAFTILPRTAGGQWRVGDQLEVVINMHDFQGFPKKSGGDVLVARLHNPTLGAGVAGQVVDHLDGSYSAMFSLLWEGDAQVEVTLVHPSEAVTVLRRLTHQQPDRISFKSVFRSVYRSQTTTCNVCLRPTQQPMCNYTDLRTGEPWFCYKPKDLGCDTRVSHVMGDFKQDLEANEEKLFQSGVNMKVFIGASGAASVTVMPKAEDQPGARSGVMTSGPSGYYYRGLWLALGGAAVRHFNSPSAISECLRGKAVHMYGDSTIRQWFTHLLEVLPDLKEFNLQTPRKVGPFMALNIESNILVTYRCHGPPIRFASMPTSELRYIANELDVLTGSANTVVVIGIWAHFSTFPVEVYVRRLQGIREAVLRLLDREPGTVVIIRTANPKALTLYEALTNSDWYSLQRDKVLRAMFKGLPVHLVDAWEMGLAHDLPHELHPQTPIVKNMIDVLLSYICPQKGG